MASVGGDDSWAVGGGWWAEVGGWWLAAVNGGGTKNNIRYIMTGGVSGRFNQIRYLDMLSFISFMINALKDFMLAVDFHSGWSALCNLNPE